MFLLVFALNFTFCLGYYTHISTLADVQESVQVKYSSVNLGGVTQTDRQMDRRTGKKPAVSSGFTRHWVMGKSLE